VIRPLLLHNDRIRRSDELFFSPGQVGLLNGWGVFSTIKVADGVLFAFERHYARMKHDAGLMHVPFPWSEAELEEKLLSLVEANHDYNSTLRISVVRNKGTVFVGPAVERECELIAFTVPRATWGNSVKLGLIPNGRHAASPFAGTKILSWSMNLVWYEQAHLEGLDEVILLNERDEVSECTSANIFAVFGGAVATPPLSSGCLPGVTRDLLLHEIRIPGVTLEERVLRIGDLEAADGMFITSATRDLLPVDSIQGLTIRRDEMALDSLLNGLQQYESKYVARAQRRAARRA
jgi:branched-chain amino acid aminotransferase